MSEEKKDAKSSVIVWLVIFVIVALIPPGIHLVKKGQRWKSIDDKCLAYVNNGFFERAIELSNSIGENDKSPATYSCIGTAYYNIGNLQLALKNFRKAAELQDSIYKYEDPDLDIYIHTHIAKILREMKRYDEAVEYYKKALDIAKNNKRKYDYGDILEEIAGTYEEKGDIDNAIKYYQDALIYCVRYNRRANIYRKIAELCEKKGDKTQAERYLNKAVELEQESNQNY